MIAASKLEKPAWHSRGYLPHWEAGETAQAITFRLADSLPASLIEAWRHDLQSMPEGMAHVERRKRIEVALDRGHGAGDLARPEIAALVEETLLLFDGQRYRLQAWVIMPNHVHILATPLEAQSLSIITNSWKSFTATRANSLLSRKGRFWAPEYFDRAIRDENHFANACAYIAMNPVKAGLCERPEAWRFSSSWKGRSAI